MGWCMRKVRDLMFVAALLCPVASIANDTIAQQDRLDQEIDVLERQVKKATLEAQLEKAKKEKREAEEAANKPAADAGLPPGLTGGNAPFGVLPSVFPGSMGAIGESATEASKPPMVETVSGVSGALQAILVYADGSSLTVREGDALDDGAKVVRVSQENVSIKDKKGKVIRLAFAPARDYSSATGAGMASPISLPPTSGSSVIVPPM